MFRIELHKPILIYKIVSVYLSVISVFLIPWLLKIEKRKYI